MATGVTIPKFVVDLSKPPEDRYAHIVPHFQNAVESCNLPDLFDELLHDLAGNTLGKALAAVSRVLMRRVYVSEESAELKGISKAMGIPMHIMVAFNVLLDLLLGCTSGGARTIDPNSYSSPWATRILHFRTLDWGMDRLRRIVVELDFVRHAGGPVVATTVTYLGYVGVLTGVRKGLSMSLNFRPYHARETLRERVAFRWHQAMVVLGYRQSISSVLRGFLLDPLPGDKTDLQRGKLPVDADVDLSDAQGPHIQDILTTLSTSRSTAAYLIFCLPEKIYIVEKDHKKASIRESDTFLTAYNHDARDEADPSQLQQAAQDLAAGEDATGMADLVAYSVERKNHLDELWQKRVRACKRRHKQEGQVVTLRDVIQFLKDDEISNDETHYAVIMDPTDGKVIWRKLYESDETDWSDE
ncbi:hypothetical protein FDECE_13692 [Fusarium decemcellulare]|nr:hypothetical protein FDECE_13692 [Fusarium decemcellulare]